MLVQDKRGLAYRLFVEPFIGLTGPLIGRSTGMLLLEFSASLLSLSVVLLGVVERVEVDA